MPQSSATKISDARTAVCFLDILGYRELVKAAFTNEARITEIYDSMKRVVFFERTFLLSQPQFPYYYGPIKEKTSVAVLSDSLVISLPLSAVPNVPPMLCLTVFLAQIAAFYTYFLTKLRRFMRGAIAVGQHYQNTLDTKLANTFILSQALVESYELTNKFSRWPRILVGASVFAFIRDSGTASSLLSENVKLDQDSRFYLDVYRPFFNESGNLDSGSQDLMGDVASVVREQVKVNLGNEAVLEKLRWFKNYHNERLSTVLPSTLKIEDF